MVEYLPRALEKEIEKFLEDESIIVIKGPRQSGKTTLMLHLSEKYKGSYYTFEDQKILEIFEKNTELF